MTWLPLPAGDLPERDAVLGLKEEPYAVLREALTAAWRMTDPELLDLCRLRLAQLVEAEAELAGADEGVLERLATWESAAFGEAERAALSYAEQYHYDHTRLSEAQRSALEEHLQEGAAEFTWALHVNDAYLRMLSLLRIAPDPPGSAPRPERTPSGGAADFAGVRTELNHVTVRQSLVDDVTSEVIRLHNAAHQQCRY
jgi:hypothetical protein